MESGRQMEKHARSRREGWRVWWFLLDWKGSILNFAELVGFYIASDS